MLQQAITNSLETNRNYKTDKYTSENETLLHGINRRVKMTKDRIREFENKSIHQTVIHFRKTSPIK